MRSVGDIALDAEVRAIASGAITDGAPVIVNADGTVSGVSSDPDSLGTAVDVYTGSNGTGAVVYDTGQDKILYAYTDASNYGATVVGTVSGSSISFGTPVVFSSAASYYIDATYDSNAGKTGIFWADYGDGEKGKACVATISGTSVSYGSTVTFSSTVTSGQKDSTYDSSENKILLAYRESTTVSKVVAATISGTDISFGSGVSIYGTVSGNMNAIAIEYDSNANKGLVIYKNPDNSNNLDSKVVSLSGTTVSLGSQTSVSANVVAGIDTTFDSTNNKIVVGYRYDAGDELTRLAVATISGTSVSYGTAVSTGLKIRSDSVDSLHYNATAQKVVYAGCDTGDSNKQKYIIASVSGTSISIDSTTTYFDSTNSYQNASEYDPDSQKSILFYTDNGNSDPVARTLTVGTGDNITSENFIGFAHAAYADGQKATVKTTGSIARNIPSLPLTITYDSKSFDHSSQDVIAEEIRFKPDGTKFYLLTNDNDIIYQYAMSTAWDISTASYESKSFNVQSQEGTPQGMAINADGSSFYICGQSRVVYQYNLTTDYDISTASYASKSFSLTTQMSSGSAWSLDFDSTGTKMYAIHSNSGIVYQYTLSSAFDVSTASYASKSFDTSSQTSDSTSIAITSDGTSLYVVSSGSDQVFKYTLSTAFDLATASYSGISLTTTSQDNFPYGVAVKTDETKLYVTGTQNDSVYQYSLSDSLTIGQQYFVQTDGTLGTSADDPSVIAGTAIGASDIIVKG